MWGQAPWKRAQLGPGDPGPATFLSQQREASLAPLPISLQAGEDLADLSRSPVDGCVVGVLRKTFVFPEGPAGRAAAIQPFLLFRNIHPPPPRDSLIGRDGGRARENLQTPLLVCPVLPPPALPRCFQRNQMFGP
jgi:hypothetical protein